MATLTNDDKATHELIIVCILGKIKIPVLWVNRPYLNLLVKPRFFRFFGKNIILCILKDDIFMTFRRRPKMAFRLRADDDP